MARMNSIGLAMSGPFLTTITLSACSGDARDGGSAEPAGRSTRFAVATQVSNPQHAAREVPSGELDAASAKALFNLRGCNVCHEVKEQRIGPSYLAVSQRYAADHAENPGAREQALNGAYPGECYTPSTRLYRPPGDPEYPFHDRTIRVTQCGRICIGKRKISLSTVFAGQILGIREVDNEV